MSSFIIYSIEVIIASVILGGFYFIFFKNLTLFKFNRFYLLMSIVIPFVLPLLELPVKASEALPKAYILLDEVVVGANQANAIESASHVSILQCLYMGIALVLLARIVIGVFSISSLFKKSKKIEVLGTTVYLCSQSINPFSIFKRIVVSHDTFHDVSAMQRILLHEKTHIKQHHGLDCFVAEIICALFWFNPMLWWLKKELKSTHEYLADEKVLEHDFDLAEYFMLMLNNIVGRNVGLANNFNQSLNLKRMKMMKKKRTSRFVKIMSMVIMPLILVFALVACKQAVRTADVATTASSSEVVLMGHGRMDESASSEKLEVEPKIEGKVYKITDELPSFPGGDDALTTYLMKSLRYPAAAVENNVQGRVYVEFVVTKGGDVLDISALRLNIKADKLGSENKDVYRLLVEESKRVVKAMPKWVPGVQDGKAVNVSYVLPINFTL